MSYLGKDEREGAPGEGIVLARGMESCGNMMCLGDYRSLT